MSDDEIKRAMAKKGKAAEEDRLMEATLRGPLGNSATHAEWRSQMRAIKGWSRPTFKRRLQGFKQRHPELTGARWWGDPYSLPTQPTAAMADLVASLRTWLAPRSGTFPNRTVRPIEPEPAVTQTGSAGLTDLDLIAKARAHVKSAKME
jgi:hypothetical protein